METRFRRIPILRCTFHEPILGGHSSTETSAPGAAREGGSRDAGGTPPDETFRRAPAHYRLHWLVDPDLLR
jgi:hypothetical protein